MSDLIRVAISGGGLAGATLFRALLQHEHLDVHIFESAEVFKEAGAAIGVTRNALEALELIGSSTAQCLERAGAVPQKGARFMLAQGESRGEMIGEFRDIVRGKHVTSIVHRAAFLRELLADVPQDRMHASKRLETVDRESINSNNNNNGLTLRFADGSTHECDVLIGADGIHSTVRKLVLGENDPAASPRNSGWWAVMSLKPYADARASIGDVPVDINDAREYSWIGDGTYILHNVLDHGTLVQFVLCSRDDAAAAAVASDRWHRTVSADEIKKLYQGWPPHLFKAVKELLCDQPEQAAIYLWEHPPARTYVSGPICLMGDAAHATTPWQGSGGGMSIEDALVLSTVLGRAKTPVEALVALKVYDQVRRPRTQRIVESSRETGVIMSGKGDETMLDHKKLSELLLPRWDFILDYDNEAGCREAIEMMESALREESTHST